MAHTFTSLFTHIVFSTKQREPFLLSDLRPRLFQYMGGIINQTKGRPISINGMEDHVHVLAIVPADMAVSVFLRDLKGESSRWAKEVFGNPAFGWQTGYGAFSVSASNVRAVREYILNQEAHHRRRTFREEYLEFLQRHGIAYDERFVFE